MVSLDGSEYLTVAEVGVLRDIQAPTLYKAIERGALPSRRVLGRLLISKADALAFEVATFGDAPGRVKKARGPGRPKAPGSSTAA